MRGAVIIAVLGAALVSPVAAGAAGSHISTKPGTGVAQSGGSSRVRRDRAELRTLLERVAGVWQAESIAAQGKSKIEATELPSLLASVKTMNGELSKLSVTLKKDRAKAVAVAVNAYVGASSGKGYGGLALFGQPEKAAAAKVYSKLASSDVAVAIGGYHRVVGQVRHDKKLIKVHLAVILSTKKDLFLNAKNLANKAAAASKRAAMLGGGGIVEEAVAESSALSLTGPSTLSATQLAQWYTAQGYSNNTGVGIVRLARAYIEAGNQEGISGDVAFAQSILETGGFAIMSGTNNFAGIGACNSCDGGFNYPSYVQGIRAQIQLLKAYSDKSLTDSQLVGGVAMAGINTLSVRGCCTTWPALSTVWSTGKRYGDVILGIYTDMLGYAIAHVGPIEIATPAGKTPPTGITITAAPSLDGGGQWYKSPLLWGLGTLSRRS